MTAIKAAGKTWDLVRQKLKSDECALREGGQKLLGYHAFARGNYTRWNRPFFAWTQDMTNEQVESAAKKALGAQ